MAAVPSISGDVDDDFNMDLPDGLNSSFAAHEFQDAEWAHEWLEKGLYADGEEPLKVLIMGISFMARCWDALRGKGFSGRFCDERLGMGAEVYMHNWRGGYINDFVQNIGYLLRVSRPTVVLFEVGSNDLCWSKTDPVDFAQEVMDLVDISLACRTVEAVVVLEVLHRARPDSGMRDGKWEDSLTEYNQRVDSFNACMRDKADPGRGVLFWTFERKVNGAEGMAISRRDGVHVEEHRLRKYYHEIRGAVLMARRLLRGQGVTNGPVLKPRSKKRGPGTARKQRKREAAAAAAQSCHHTGARGASANQGGRCDHPDIQ